MRFRLEMENVGGRVVRYDAQQVDVNDSMLIEGTDRFVGSAPFIAMTVQTGGGPRALNPGERTVLFEGLDIAEQYLLTAPGTYEVRFRGQSEGFGEIAIPPSNVITIRIANGPVQSSRLIARSLLEMDPHSRVGVVEEGQVVPLGRSPVKGVSLALTRASRTKGDSLRVLIWVTMSPAVVEVDRLGGQRGPVAEGLGRCEWGEVYFWAAAGNTEAPAALRRKIATALKIENL